MYDAHFPDDTNTDTHTHTHENTILTLDGSPVIFIVALVVKALNCCLLPQKHQNRLELKFDGVASESDRPE